MRNKFRIIGVSLAAMAGLLLVSGVAWANPNKEPLSGCLVYSTGGDSRQFVEREGVYSDA